MTKQTDLKPYVLALLILIFSGISFAQTPAAENSMPTWVREHFEFMIEGTGRWITDNAAYKNENEPFDAYGTEWKWGIGQKSISGRLFGLKDQKEVGNFWEYKLFWHPHEHRVVFQQFGGSGVYGSGEMRSIETGGKTERMTEMTFYAPDGTSWRDLHRLYETPDTHETISFGFKDGSWQRNRTYIWKREK